LIRLATITSRIHDLDRKWGDKYKYSEARKSQCDPNAKWTHSRQTNGGARTKNSVAKTLCQTRSVIRPKSFQAKKA